MFKSFTAAVLASAINATESAAYGRLARARYGPTKDYSSYKHDQVWGHGHYEPGEIERFDNHFAEIYGADDLAWGPNGYMNPHTENDTVHNWDDQGDAFVCHGCGGHGCTLCGGYGHEHKNSRFGDHGHNLRTGFGIGHSHAYLGDKVRSSYNRYGHGVGGRYTQRWSNGYGNRYGIGHGHRYGLAHRWSMYNGYGKGNPSSKGSVLGYGIGANAAIPQRFEAPTVRREAVEADPYDVYDQYYEYDEPEYGYEEDYAEPEYEMEYEEAEYAEPEYEEEYEEPEYEMEYEEPAYEAPKSYDTKDYYIDFARGFGARPEEYDARDPVGETKAYRMRFGHGSGNHSPWHGEIYRHDAGLWNYNQRPKQQKRYHMPTDYYNNEWF